jgi:hypothetical protein
VREELLIADSGQLDHRPGLYEVLGIGARVPHVLEERERPAVEGLQMMNGTLGAQPRVHPMRVVERFVREGVVLQHRLQSGPVDEDRPGPVDGDPRPSREATP